MESSTTATQSSLENCIDLDDAQTHHKLAFKDLERFRQSGQREELERSITHNRTALKLRPEGHPDRAGSLCKLAVSLLTRYEMWGRSEDLEEAIELNRAALELRPEGHPKRSSPLIKLAGSLHIRYEQHGRIDDLEEAIELNRAALELQPNDHPGRFKTLGNLASSILTRYERQGRVEDLDHALDLYWAVLELQPKDHPDRSTTFNNLANSILTRYERQGRVEDIDYALDLHRAALELRPEGHPDRLSSLNNLAISLSARFKQYGRRDDLEEAIVLERMALKLRPEGHPDRSTAFNNLADSLRMRYGQHGRTEDLVEAIELERAALELHSEGHPDRSFLLNNLADSLLTRYKQQRRVEDLEDALNLYRAALELRSEGDPLRSTSLINLASSLSIRFRQYGKTEDLEEAIELGQAALELCPKGHPSRSQSLMNLAITLYTRIEKQWRTEEFEECVRLLELAAAHDFSGSLDRLLAAREWSRLARLYNHATAFGAYRATLSILQHVLTVNPTLHAQHDFLLGSGGHRMLSLDAASYAVEKNQLELAVEILEQGRGLLWSQLRGLRHPLEQLANANEELVDRFRDVSSQLENLATSHEMLVSDSTVGTVGSLRLDSESGQKSFDELLKLKRHFSCEQEGIINEIRQVPGFENFLEATPFKVLQQAASEGPVIVVNHSEYRSDALIILSRRDLPVLCIPLDNAFYEDSINICEGLLEARRFSGAASHDYDKKLREAMKILWDRVVSKVVEKLTEVGIAKGSRIWWCPASMLAALPFHAAGPFTDADGTSKYLLDDYVSSYTPTLGALINARSNSKSIEPKLLIVGDTKTLNSTRQEIRNIRNCTGDSILERTILLDNKASRRTVIENLRKATWIHFACHGHLDTKPFDSSFKLSDSGLTLLDIIQANVPNAEFAFLSACHTAELSHSGAHDEALHLAAAMQFSGFRSVIGTMWELYDEDGPCIARAVYEHMNECEDGKLRYKMAAAGLRKAALELRGKDWMPTERWVNFVHIGA